MSILTEYFSPAIDVVIRSILAYEIVIIICKVSIIGMILILVIIKNCCGINKDKNTFERKYQKTNAHVTTNNKLNCILIYY